MHRDDFVRSLNELLQAEGVADYGPNGLQVEGRTEVLRVVTGVTACQDLVDQARRLSADALVVHHGIFWNHQSPVLKGHHKMRVSALLAAEMSLLAYHLPLDRHELVGNNAPALRALGASDLKPFGWAKGTSVGFSGQFEPPLAVEEFLNRVRATYGVEPTTFLHGPDLIRRVGLISGAAQGEVLAAVDQGLDVFVTGEVSEYNFHIAKEEGIHHISVGHHASERVGPRELADWIREHLGLWAEFVDVPNPV